MRALIVTAVLAAAVAGCGGDDGGGGGSDDPILIGTSLPLTGEDSQTGTLVKQGYDAWLDVINANGGILGRKVELKILDDASNQNTVISDFNALISRENVDFVVGTFSTRLALPAVSIAERHRMLYVDPAGAAPEMFDRNSKLYFYTEPAPPWEFGTPFAEYIASLPEAERPKTVAYVLTQDPFTSSTIDGMKKVLQAAGVKTVLRATYPFGARNFDPIAARVKQSGAEMVVTAGGFDDEVAIIRSMLKAGAAPRILYQTNAPGARAEFAPAVGEQSTEGVFWAAGYTPTLTSHQNKAFVASFERRFKHEPSGLSAFAFAAGQVLSAAVEAVGEKGIEDQEALADWLHANEVDTVIGKLKWDARGESQGTFATGQWQGGKPQIILPADLATTKEILTCWRSC